MGSNPACPTKPSSIAPPLTPGDRRARIEALNRALLAGGSATLTLEQWCGPGAVLVAERIAGDDILPDAAVRAILGAADCRFRHVRLCCGALVMSEAHNWYVPARLTPEMNAALEATPAPFGRVVAPLGFRRRTLEARVLPGEGPFVLAHLAMLLDRAGEVVCVVREHYARGVVDGPA